LRVANAPEAGLLDSSGRSGNVRYGPGGCCPGLVGREAEHDTSVARSRADRIAPMG
jgi:hypothetical protein